MSVRSRQDLALPATGEIFDRYCELRSENPLETLSTVLIRLSKEVDLDIDVLEGAARAQQWDQRYQELMLLQSAELLGWSKVTAPMRHLQLVLEMQRLAMEKFQMMVGKDVRTAEEARRLAHTAVEMERLLLGQATVIGAQATDADLDARIKWLQERLKIHEDEAIEGNLTKS